MIIDGKYVIGKIADRLKFCNLPPTDTEIVSLLCRLNKYEIMQLTSLGEIDKWHNESIARSPKE